MPQTSAARQRVLVSGESFTLVNPALKLKKQPLANKIFPQLAQAVFELEQKIKQTNQTGSASCAVNLNAQFTPHVDSGTGAGQSLSMIVGLGDYYGGELVVEHNEIDIQYKPFTFNGWTQRHWTKSFSGERFSLVWFTAKQRLRSDEKKLALSLAHQFNITSFRPNSTDIQAINEVLGPKQCYAPLCDYRNHRVLDCGAHIGTFARFVLSQGAASVIAYEPDPENCKFFQANVPEATLIQAAVIGTSSSKNETEEHSAEFILAPRRQEDKAINTWRHCLKIYAPSSWENPFSSSNRRIVKTLDFVRHVLTDDITVVKLDIEGAEFDILDAVQDWRNVQYLVIEYSLTRRRAMQPFRNHLNKLNQLGFDIEFDFQNTTLFQQPAWSAHTDTLLFCRRRT
eukprot:CAMPEP_0197317764 /NCGR_PEP_ID=MMETSP0891-20130614/48360_1 /TAXON_ID=44058 ORGANISM="Aureoumbra lagunensis, Strain CCMP1510" /NCGR_SAMPLE_ID=MMETSP0891 /ASSEMBLY_ACC=CAM_ASM_000534 /LENGTH=397 /DNA_ID=CAMNT_0042807911 /DNA_START=783 /DNA_END=1976 /DNA_ORIENTATION=-